MTVIQLASNAVVAKLINADRDVKLLASSLLSYTVEGAEFSSAFKSGMWDGRSSFFDYNNGTFPAGFADKLYAVLVNHGYKVQRVKKALPDALGPIKPKVGVFGDDPRYDYQPETVKRLERYGQMIAQIATGGGKSYICRLAVARIGRTTLFLTTRSVLMYQMKDAFEEDGKKVGVLGDGEWKPTKGINVAMVQTLSARLKEPNPDDTAAVQRRQASIRAKTIKLLETFEFIIGEEAHEAGGNSYYEILRHCRNAYYRLALTATPFMRPDAEANMRLMACFGSVGIRISEKMLIDRGILARPYFKYVYTNKPSKLFRSTSWPRAYKIGIVESEHRNNHIVYEVKRAIEYGLTVMILVQHKAHGRILNDKLKAAGVKSEFIFGDSDQETRRAALRRLKEGKTNALIGSTILDVGVDVPAVGMVVLAGGGKAEVALRQRIGRGLRAKKGMPNVAFVLDFRDTDNSYLREHYAARRDIVSSTPGFAENIIEDGKDFMFESLGFVKK